MTRRLLALLLGLVVSCGGGAAPEGPVEEVLEDTAPDADVFHWGGDLPSSDSPTGEVEAELPGGDSSPDLSSCEEGGCFGDPCDENGDCGSGWCVQHLGDSVCSQECLEDCPQGWSCKQVAGTKPDVIYICVSDAAHLCIPCTESGDCKDGVGPEDACVNYGPEGAFCGAVCQEDADCPGGFACEDRITVDGIETRQCVAAAGVCECSERSVLLGLFTDCAQENGHGVCQGKRVCTEEGLSACDAPAPAVEICNGLDDDCDGQLDEDTCEDGNGCTVDSCAGPDGCLHDPMEGGECLDGDSCTVGDHCEAGVCVGTPLECSDDNPCTDDSCDGLGGCQFMANDALCDDQDPCTVGDQCGGGTCQGTPVDCDCQGDPDCAALEDGDLCNGTLVCDLTKLPYRCVVAPETIVACPTAQGADALCLSPVCDPVTGACGFDPVNPGGPCEDGDPCTFGDLCQGGQCLAGPALSCDDGNPCTADSCASESGCLFTPVDGACDDGNLCTTGDACAGGACVGAAVLDCGDDNPCTDNLCDPAVGCVTSLNTAPCDDGDACTTGDHCHLGGCIGGMGLVCDDANQCTDDSCEPQVGCVHALSPTKCGDEDPCTVDLCDPVTGCFWLPKPCADEDPCTSDSCDEETGACVFEAVVCDDGNPCTTDACVLEVGGCVFSQVTCDDGDLCTVDFCDVTTGGCAHAFNTAPCPGGQCLAGACVPDCEPVWYGWAGIGTNNGWTCADVCAADGGATVDWDGLAEQQYYCHLLHPDAVEFVTNPSNFSYPIWEPQANRCKLNSNGAMSQGFAGNGTTEYGDQILCKCEDSQCDCVPETGDEDGLPCDFKDNDCDGQVDEGCVDDCGDGYVLAFDITDDGTNQLPDGCSWLGDVLFDKGTSFKLEWWSAAGAHFGPATWDLLPQIASIRQNFDTCSGSNYAMGSEDGNWYMTLVQVNNILTLTGWGDDPANGTDHYYGRIQNGYLANDEVYAVDYPDWDTAWAARYTSGDRFRVCYKP